MTYPHWSKKYRWHIPTDWNGEDWDCCLLFYPDSPEWKAIVRGTLQHIERGRSWDETTGSIKDVQAIARLISLSFDPSPEVMQLPEVSNIMTCLSQIQDDVAAIRAMMEQQSDYTAQIEAIKVAVSLLDPGLATLITLTELGNEALGTQDILQLPPGGG